MAISYVLPLRTSDNAPMEELGSYLKDLATIVEEVLVVDGSSPHALAAHQSRFGPSVTVVPPQQLTLMGKVGNVMTGVRLATYERVIVADDDVRYTAGQLARVAAALDEAEIVRPQNYSEASTPSFARPARQPNRPDPVEASSLSPPPSA